MSKGRKVYIIECVDDEGSLRSLIEYIGTNGNTGHSFDIVVDPDASESDGRRMFGWDGDGRDRIISIKEKQLAQDSRPMPKLKEIVCLLEKIVAARGAMDGGSGSGQKGHTTAEQGGGKKLSHNNTPETLHTEGMRAARGQVKQAESPYAKGTEEHKHWTKGYKSFGHGGNATQPAVSRKEQNKIDGNERQKKYEERMSAIKLK